MSDPRSRRIAPFVAVAVAAVMAVMVYVFASAAPSGDSAATPLMDEPAPAVQGLLVDRGGTDVTEQTWQLSRQKGDWVVVNFFDSTCVPCVREHPELVKFAEQEADRPDGVELVSVVWGEFPEASMEWLRDEGATWPIIADDGSIANAFAVAKVPETWIIDPLGIVRVRLISEVTADQLTAYIATMAGTATPSSAAGTVAVATTAA